MLHNLSTPEFAFAAIGTICLYLIIMAIAYGKKLLGTWGKVMAQPLTPAVATAASAQKSWNKHDEFPPLIDKPADHPEEQTKMYEEDGEGEVFFQPIEDDGSAFLLQEAEKIVERVQNVIENIASSPANPEEVTSKIRAILSKYRLFLETEYYEAINSFVSTSVKRDCDLTLSEDDLTNLWTRQAA